MQKNDELIKSVRDNLSKIEAGLEFFDQNIPTILGEFIDIVAIDKHKRLVMVAVAPKKVTTLQAARFALGIYYCWNFICDFREDFFTEVEEEKEIKPAPKPPRVVVLAPETNKQLTAYTKHFQECYIDVALYSYQLDAGELTVHKESLDQAPSLKKSEKTHFNIRFNRLAVKQVATWENWLGEDSMLKGYDKARGILEFLGIPVEPKEDAGVAPLKGSSQRPKRKTEAKNSDQKRSLRKA